MYCKATLDSFETQSISNFRGCSDKNQTCSGPMVTKVEAVRQVEMTDEQLDEYRLEPAIVERTVEETSTDESSILRAVPEFRSDTPEKNFRSGRRPRKPKQETTIPPTKQIVDEKPDRVTEIDLYEQTNTEAAAVNNVAEIYRIIHDMNETLASSD